VQVSDVEGGILPSCQCLDRISDETFCVVVQR
jgi:hypothetical protein